MDLRDGLTPEERESLNQACRGFELTAADRTALAAGLGVTTRLIGYWFAPPDAEGRNIITATMAGRAFDDFNTEERRRLELARLVAGELTVETTARFTGDEKRAKTVNEYENLFEVVKRLDNLQNGTADVFLGHALTGAVVDFNAGGTYSFATYYAPPAEGENSDPDEPDDDDGGDFMDNDDPDWMPEEPNDNELDLE